MIDDSALFHGTYDPIKAKAYYERTKKLKGRKPAAAKISPGRGRGRSTPVGGRVGGKANRSKTKSRRAELQAQKEALERRLDHLREVLDQKVKAAKALQGKPKSKKDEKDTAPETKIDTADRGKAEKSRKALTGSQKAKKAKASKEAYEKEHPNSLSEDVEVLQDQIKDIRAKIQKAVEDARARQKKAGPKKS